MEYLSILLAFIQELFVSNIETVQQALFPAWIIPLLTLAISGATTGISMGKQAKAGREARNAQNSILNDQRSLADEYNAERSKSFLDTQSGMSGVKNLKDQYKNFIKSSNNNLISGGGTNEAQVATKGAANNQYNSAINSLSGLGTQYKMGLGDRYSQMLQQIMGGQNQFNQGELQSWANVSQGGANTFMNTAGTTDWEKAFSKE